MFSQLTINNLLPACIQSQYQSVNRHYDLAMHSSTWLGRVVHALVYSIESIPILGLVIYFAEKYLFTKSNNKTVQKEPLKPFIPKTTIQQPKTNFKPLVLDELHLALRNQQLQKAKTLLQSGLFNPNITYHTRRYGQEMEIPVLEYLCGNYFRQIGEFLNGIEGVSAETATHLLREGLYLQNDLGELKKFGFESMRETIQCLLDRGAKVEALPDYTDPKDQISAFAILLEEPSAPSDIIETFIHHASQQNINAPLKGTGETALALAKKFNNCPARQNVINKLVELGAIES